MHLASVAITVAASWKQTSLRGACQNAQRSDCLHVLFNWCKLFDQVLDLRPPSSCAQVQLDGPPYPSVMPQRWVSTAARCPHQVMTVSPALQIYTKSLVQGEYFRGNVPTKLFTFDSICSPLSTLKRSYSTSHMDYDVYDNSVWLC